jgi:hypothetical protein
MEKGLQPARGTAAHTEDSLGTHSEGDSVGPALTLLTYIQEIPWFKSHHERFHFFILVLAIPECCNINNNIKLLTV